MQNKVLVMCQYRMAHNSALAKVLKNVVKDPRILSQVDFFEIYKNRHANWFDVDFTKYRKIILYPREATYQFFDFERLRQLCIDNGIELVNGANVDQIDKYSTNQIWTANGINVPKMYLLQHKLDMYEVDDSIYPAIISAYAGHGEWGHHTLIFDRDSIAHQMNSTHVNVDAIVTGFIEYRDPDGYYRKGRVIRLQDNYIDTSIVGNRASWHVHHTTKGSEFLEAGCDWYRNRVPDFDAQVRKLFETTKIEIGALDFCAVNGEILPFEITVPYHRSYRRYEFMEKRYNKHFDNMLYSIVNYYIVYLREILGINMDYCKFQYELIDYIFRNKGITHG